MKTGFEKGMVKLGFLPLVPDSPPAKTAEGSPKPSDRSKVRKGKVQDFRKVRKEE
jgi:hypothetical protein